MAPRGLTLPTIETATFGNKGGSHQLLDTTLPKSAAVLDLVRFLVDRPAGHIDPGSTWSPYWGCGPAGDWWVLWRGAEDAKAPRKNMVQAWVALVRLEEVGLLSSLSPLIEQLSATGEHLVSGQLVPSAEVVVDELALGRRPVVVASVGTAPRLLMEVWHRLWPTARASLSLRTLFGPESLDRQDPPHVVVLPSELRGRWHCHRFPGEAAREARSEKSSRTQELLAFNAAALPGDLTVLGRIERIASRLDRLHVEGAGGVSDALLVARTVEALPFDFELPEDDVRVLVQALGRIGDGTVGDIRAASLVSLDWLDGSEGVKNAVARWVEQHLPDQPIADAVWIVAQHTGSDHVEWWRNAITEGLARGCRSKDSPWGTAVWTWWSARPALLRQVSRYLGSRSWEKWLVDHAPAEVGHELLSAVTELCRERNWPRLLARALADRPLEEAHRLLRDSTKTPEAGMDELLVGRADLDVVQVGAGSDWEALRQAAAAVTISKPALLTRIEDHPGFLGILRLHLEHGRTWPRQFVGRTFLMRLFDDVVAGNVDALAVAGHLGADAGGVALSYSNQDALWGALLGHAPSDFVEGAVDAWWQRFLEDEGVAAPVVGLRARVREQALEKVRGGPMTLVVGLLRLFPEIGQDEFRRWMKNLSFRWAVGDHERLAQLLVERDWRAAGKGLRWSWEPDLKVVAWHARDLLSWYDKFWSPPDGVLAATDFPGTSRNSMKVTFLASNPMVSDRLALGEEVRAIEQKVCSSKHGEGIQIRQRWAVRPGDLQQILLEDEPTVVHFSGHGAGAAGIVLHAGSEDEERLLDARVLADLFRVHKQNIRVVLLNACYSEQQAKAVVDEIDFVVGMSDSIGDDAARVFAAAFYQGLGFGKSVQSAFDQGVLELKLLGLDDDVDIPVLRVRDGVDASSEILVTAS